MPFKSKAQRRKFAELLVNGKITPEVFEEWNRETGGAKLPERVKHKAGKKKSAKKPQRKTAGKRKVTSRRKTTAKRKNESKRAPTSKRARTKSNERTTRRTDK